MYKFYNRGIYFYLRFKWWNIIRLMFCLLKYKKEYIIVYEYVDKVEVYVFNNNLNIYIWRMIWFMYLVLFILFYYKVV